MQYLKSRLALTAVEGKVDGLRKEYDAYQKQIWNIETKSVTSNVSERDGCQGNQFDCYGCSCKHDLHLLFVLKLPEWN